MNYINLDLKRTIGEIDPLIFGGYAEHARRCIYGGIYDIESPISDKNGFRQDLLNVLKRWNMPVIRWPGGNFSSGYHWQDGIGHVSKRPQMMNLPFNELESNQFGTDEFIKFCRLLGTEPYIAVNMGSGTMEQARAWVEYCNVNGNTYYSSLRQANGNVKPYNVKYWGLGNEMWGSWQIGFKEPEEYAKDAARFASVMKMTDPNIKLIICGAEPGLDRDTWQYTWNATILDKFLKLPNKLMDYLSSHVYVANIEDDYYRYMASSKYIDQSLEYQAMMIKSMVYKHKAKYTPAIAVDEWHGWQDSFKDELGQRYNLEDALVVAMYLNSFIRHADMVKMANLTMLVNAIAPVITSKDDLLVQAIFYPMEIFSKFNKGMSLDVKLICDGYVDDRYGKIPWLDVSASLDHEIGTVVLNVVNRNRDHEIEVVINCQSGELCPLAELYEVNGFDVKSQNTFEKRDNVSLTFREAVLEGYRPVHSFPPHSITVIKMKLYK